MDCASPFLLPRAWIWRVRGAETNKLVSFACATDERRLDLAVLQKQLKFTMKSDLSIAAQIKSVNGENCTRCNRSGG